MDRIISILKGHLNLAQEQLELAKAGVIFSTQEAEKSEFLVVTEAELILRVDKLQQDISRHEERLRAKNV